MDIHLNQFVKISSARGNLASATDSYEAGRTAFACGSAAARTRTLEKQ